MRPRESACFRVNGYAETTGSEIIDHARHEEQPHAAVCRLHHEHEPDLRRGNKPANVQTDCSAIDYTWLLEFRDQVTTRYTDQSATAIMQDLITTYAAVERVRRDSGRRRPAGARRDHLHREPLGDAITRIMRRIGGYWYVDYLLNVHAFLDTKPMGTAPRHR